MAFLKDLSITKQNKNKLDLNEAKAVYFRLLQESKLTSQNHLWLYCAFPLLVSYLKSEQVDAYNNFIACYEKDLQLTKQYTLRHSKINSEQFFTNEAKRTAWSKLADNYNKAIKANGKEMKSNTALFIDDLLGLLSEIENVLTDFYSSSLSLLSNVKAKALQLKEASQLDYIVVGDTFVLFVGKGKAETVFEQPKTNREKAISEPINALLKANRERLMFAMYEEQNSADWYSFDRVMQNKADKEGLTLEQYKDYLTYNDIDKLNAKAVKESYLTHLATEGVTFKSLEDYTKDKENEILDMSIELKTELER